MLTRDLLRYRLKDGAVIPGLLKPTPAMTELAERIVAHWRAGVGQHRGDVEESAQPLLHAARAMVVARGFAKLVTDACAFADPASAEELRARALAAAAARLAAGGLPADAAAFAGEIAAGLGVDAATLADRLYADLPDLARLEAAPAWTADELIGRYNLALCQGLLLSARELRIELSGRDPGARRRIFAAARFHRLLCEVHGAPAGGLRLVIGGPDAVLDQASRYGLNLAQFLPRLAAESGWSLAADLRLKPQASGHGGGRGELSLDHRSGLPGERHAQGFIPPELRELEAGLAAKLPGWRWVEPEPRPLASGEVVVPDIELERDGARVAVELFHRWHGGALGRRLDQIAAGALPRFAIGVDRAVARLREHAGLDRHPGFAAAGFLFSDAPVARALAAAVERAAG